MSGWCVVAFRKRTRPDQLCRMSISHPNSFGVGVRQHPLDPVHRAEGRVGRVVDVSVVVLLRVEEVLDVAIPEDLADPVDVLGAGGEAVGDRTRVGLTESPRVLRVGQVAREAHRLHAQGLQEGRSCKATRHPTQKPEGGF